MTADDFEAQLDADPRDWTCRLAYSDWLEEHGRQAEADMQRWLVKEKRCSVAPWLNPLASLWTNQARWPNKTYDDGDEIPNGIFRWLSAEKQTTDSITEHYASRRAAEADLCQALQLAKATRRKR